VLDPYQRSIYTSSRRRRKAVGRRRIVFAIAALAVIALIVVAVLFLYGGNGKSTSSTTGGTNTSSSGSTQTSGSTGTGSTSGSTDGSGSTSSTGGNAGDISMTVAPVDGTKPSDFDMTVHLYNGTTRITTYTRKDPIDFGPGKEYTALQGIITFRGNNYREGANYGTADVKTAKLQVLWSVPTGAIAKPGGTGSWTGSGWTGQPLIVRWPDDLKQIMNLKDAKKTEAGLTEIIYPCLDGKIYFLDLKDGTYTRSPIVSGGGPFKGTASIDPDGTPILFVGHGDGSPNKQSARVRLYSLVDQTLLYTFGAKPDPASYRSWYAYDSSALFDAAADTLIEPGENGILYTVKLNTTFDKKAGTLGISPDAPIKANYANPAYKDTGTAVSTPLWGMEDSAVAWKNYLYVTDNGGKLFCWDLNTMKLVWVQNVLDDTNTSPVFEEENGHGYIYISTSVHETAKTTASGRKGNIPIWKIDAATGEIVWKTTPYSCYTVLDVSGGVQDTPVLGQKDISNLVIYAIARTPNPGSGIIVAIDKKTGQEVWRTATNHYMWSSPVAVYTPDGKSYIVACDTIGNMFLLEGKTGKIVDYINLGTNIEASPAVFGNTIVVGTRGQKIYAVKIN
jgi:PQQ enzyme repeat/PQQ-like domain